MHVVSAPDTYRGPHRGPDAAARYADEVAAACRQANSAGPANSMGTALGERRGLSAFFVEVGTKILFQFWLLFCALICDIFFKNGGTSLACPLLV